MQFAIAKNKNLLIFLLGWVHPQVSGDVIICLSLRFLLRFIILLSTHDNASLTVTKVLTLSKVVSGQIREVNK